MATIPKMTCTAGLYLHIPFCTQRCSYCDFYFVTAQRGQDAFVNALCTELSLGACEYPDVQVSTVYLGGGTPSRLPGSSIAHIMEHLNATYNLRQVREVTLEMNPEDLTPDGLAALRSCGITRVSLGIQSFFDDELAFMNRAHSADCALQAARYVAQAGFESWTMDLIFGLPGQSLDRWEANLKRAMAFSPPHISTYNLTIEPNTPLHKQVRLGQIVPARDDDVADAYQAAMDHLREAGYEHYEVSSFARAGHQAQHNRGYWTHSNYLGFGPSAHSFWWQSDIARRWSNVRNLRQYTENLAAGKGPPLELDEILSAADLAKERIMLGLRTAEGLCLHTLANTYGVDLAFSQSAELARLAAEGMIIRTEGIVRLTDRGRHVCDTITTRLLPD